MPRLVYRNPKATVTLGYLKGLEVYFVPREPSRKKPEDGWTLDTWLSAWAEELSSRYGADQKVISNRLSQLKDKYLKQKDWIEEQMRTEQAEETMDICVTTVGKEEDMRVEKASI